MVPSVWLIMLGKDSAPSGRASRSAIAMNPVFRICSRINNIYVYAFYPNHNTHLVASVTQGTMLHFMIVSLTLWLGTVS